MASPISDAISSSFSGVKADITTVFIALFGLLFMVFSFKKTLFLLGSSDFGISTSLKIRDRKMRRARQKNKISKGLMKTSMTSQERKRREKLYTLKQERQKRSINKNKGGYSRKYSKYISKNEKKNRSSSGRSVSSKKVFMSDKYQQYLKSGAFSRGLENRVPSVRKSFHSSSSKRTDRKSFGNGRRPAGHATRDLKSLTSMIEANKNTKNYTVLNAGADKTIIVRTVDKEWFLFDEGRWSHISNVKAKEKCDKFYFSRRYFEML